MKNNNPTPRLRIIKKIILLLAFAIFLITPFANTVTNKTFFMPRPVLEDAVLQNAMINYNVHHADTFCGFTINTNVFYEESTNSSDLARYFFPNNKTELVVRGLEAARTDGVPDIAAEWLNIMSNDDDPDNYPERSDPLGGNADPRGGGYPSDNDLYTFSSKIKISPKFKQFGTNIFLFKKFEIIFVSLIFPFTQVETNMRLQEYNKQNERALINDDTGDKLNAIRNAYDAFNNPMMKYGKMGNYWQRNSGLADIKLEIGGNFKIKKHQLDIFGNVIFPTSHTPKAEYVFEPLIGNAGHWGVGAGLNLDLKLFKKLHFINKLEYLYLFKDTEKRSFDLNSNGPFSRYMLASDGNKGNRPIPLINYLTQDMNVTPGSAINWLSNLHLTWKSFNLEFGYNLFYREKEKVSLKNAWNETVGIAVFADNTLDWFFRYRKKSLANHINKTIQSNITDNVTLASPDLPANKIEASNFNLNSTQHNSILTNKIYLTGGTQINWNENLLNINIGGAYEFANSNKSLEKWQLFLNLCLQI